jgi:Uma2 family endonuclease
VKSAFDRLAPVQDKVLSFVRHGIRVGLVIDPDQHTVTVYRADAAASVLEEEQLLTIPELLPNWELPLSELWGTAAG